MKIETRYNFGDTVYHIFRAQQQTWAPCLFCGGKGTIVGLNDQSTTCPKCYGQTGKIVYGEQGWQVDGGALTIGRVRVEITAEYREGEDSIFSNYGHQSGEEHKQYMCRETGIGSGSLYDEDRLFPSLEQAQAECDKRNQGDNNEC